MSRWWDWDENDLVSDLARHFHNHSTQRLRSKDLVSQTSILCTIKKKIILQSGKGSVFKTSHAGGTTLPSFRRFVLQTNNVSFLRRMQESSFRLVLTEAYRQQSVWGTELLFFRESSVRNGSSRGNDDRSFSVGVTQ